MTAFPTLRPRILDRYIIREIVPPTFLGFIVFTFVMVIQQITLLTGVLISRGADLPTILKLFFNLLPSIFALTIPMAFLLGLLLAFGRLSAESEIVALRASGISALQMLRPVLLLSAVFCLLTFYVMAVSLPQGNTVWRETFYKLVITKARSDIKPRVFTDDLLPGMVLYVSDVAPGNGDWKDVFISDVRVPSKPKVILARVGRLAIDEARRSVLLYLEQGSVHTSDRLSPREYYQEHFRSGEFPLPFEQLFPRVPAMKGDREMSLPELRAKIDALEGKGKTYEALQYRVELHKKFAIPVACLVFGLLGLGLSLGHRKEARSAAFGLSIAVISVYYVFLRLGEQAGDTAMVPPWIGMWSANLVLGLGAAALLVLNHREAAFDPLNPAHYTTWIPRVTKRSRPRAADAGGPTRAGVIIRIPRPARRAAFVPSILDTYIARQYVGYAFLISVAFCCVFFLFHFMDIIDDVRQNHIKGTLVVHYYTFYFPEILHLVLPIAMLVATLATFGVLARRNEITAMKAGGISVYRATLPVIVLGVLGSGLLFVMGEFLLPHTNQVASRDFNEIKGRPPQSSNHLERRWILGSDNRIYNYDYMTQAGRIGPALASSDSPVSLYGLSIFAIDPKTWNLDERLYAGRARWKESEKAYDLESGWRITFKGTQQFQPFTAMRTREVEAPNYFMLEEPASDAMRFMELREHIASLEDLGVDVARLKVQLHWKLAFPLVALIMTLLGLRFSFTVGRRGALYGIGVSIAIGITYMICMRLFEHMGNNALVPPTVAAWAPNILFGATGIYLMLTLDT